MTLTPQEVQEEFNAQLDEEVKQYISRLGNHVKVYEEEAESEDFHQPGGHDQKRHAGGRGLFGGLSPKELIKNAFDAGVKLFGTPRTSEEKTLRNDLFMSGKEVPSNLIGSGLIFGVSPDPPFTDENGFIKTSVDKLIAETGDNGFSTFDYVFFPISKKSPIDVADKFKFEDPKVFDTDNKSYFYSGEAGAIIIMKK